MSLQTLKEEMIAYYKNSHEHTDIVIGRIVEKTTSHILSEVNEVYQETNIKKLVERMKKEIQEHGDMHGEGCPCNMEYADECDCKEMAFWGSEIQKWMGEVNKMWVINLKNHRKHCTPEGNKALTKIKKRITDAQSEISKLGK